MSRYSIRPPYTLWSIYGFAVVAGCMKEISSVNPGVWSGLVVDPNANGLGLMLHNPGADIINYANTNYPALTYEDGLVQIKYFESSAPWIYETLDTWSSFNDFAVHCTSSIRTETAHFLYQIGYASTREIAEQCANDWYTTIDTIRQTYLSKDPYTMMRKKWASGNRQLRQDETDNNIDILYAYSKGVVYKNLTWLYFRRNWWR